MSACAGTLRAVTRLRTSGVFSRRTHIATRLAPPSRRALGAGVIFTVLASSSRAMASAASLSAFQGYPAPIVVPPPEGGATKAVCIFLHGLGDTGHGWADVASQMPVEGVRWVFPTAPTIPVTLNGGMRMTGWYDIADLSIEGNVDDRERTLESAAYVSALIDDAIAEGIPSDKILLGGFSQGGVIALTAALRSPRKLAGVAAMSTYLALRDDYPEALSAHAKSLPVFLAHGTADMVLKYEYGQMTAARLEELGFEDVDFQTYNGMAHSACQEELQHLATFIVKNLS